MNAEQKPVRIAFLTALTLQHERNSWRITNTYMMRALQTYCGEVVQVGTISLWEIWAGKVVNKLAQFFFRKRYSYFQSIYIARRYGKIATRRLAALHADIVFAPACDIEIAYLQTDLPIVLVEGATMKLLHDYYPQFSNVLGISYHEASRLQVRALKNASLILNPSEWAARSVVEDYQTDPGKVRVVPYGANMTRPISLEEAQRKRQSGHCRLLFVGVDWQRKGGDIAFATLQALVERGIQAELIVVGCVPPARFSSERMTVIPYLSKNDQGEYAQMEMLFQTADFLFVPTRQELFGVVFSEASAFGLPVIATETGGVAGAIRNGENGVLLSFDAGSDEYAQAIAEVYQDDQRYSAMVRASRLAFDQRLSWDAWGRTMQQLFAELFAERSEVDGDDASIVHEDQEGILLEKPPSL